MTYSRLPGDFTGLETRSSQWREDTRGGPDLSGAHTALNTLKSDLFTWSSQGQMMPFGPKKAYHLRSLRGELLPQTNQSWFCSSPSCPVPPS